MNPRLQNEPDKLFYKGAKTFSRMTIHSVHFHDIPSQIRPIVIRLSTNWPIMVAQIYSQLLEWLLQKCFYYGTPDNQLDYLKKKLTPKTQYDWSSSPILPKHQGWYKVSFLWSPFLYGDFWHQLLVTHSIYF